MPFKKKSDIKNNLKPLTQQKINKKGLKASSPINTNRSKTSQLGNLIISLLFSENHTSYQEIQFYRY